MRGIVPEIVESKDIKQANSLLNTSRSTGRIVGPTVAGVLVATLGGEWAIAIDATSFFIAAARMVQVNIPSHPLVAQNSVFQRYERGGRIIGDHPVGSGRSWEHLLRGTPFRWGYGKYLDHHCSAQFWFRRMGTHAESQGDRTLNCRLAILRFQLRRPLRDGMIAIAIAGLPMIVLGQGYVLPVLFLAALAGAGSTTFGNAWDTSLQQAVPHDMLSRVCAFDDFGSFITIPIDEILALPLADAFGYHTMAITGGLVFMVVALLPLSERLIRRMTPYDIQAPNPHRQRVTEFRQEDTDNVFRLGMTDFENDSTSLDSFVVLSTRRVIYAET